MKEDNLIRFEEPVNEGCNATVTVTCKDDDGVDAIPASFTYTLYNYATKAIINARSAVAVTGSTATRLIVLTAADNAIIDTSSHLEEHRIQVTYTYGAGGTKTGKQEIQVTVVNLTTPTA